MTSVKGHLMAIDFPEQYQAWGKCSPLCLFEAPIIKSVIKVCLAKAFSKRKLNMEILIAYLKTNRAWSQFVITSHPKQQSQINSLYGPTVIEKERISVQKSLMCVGKQTIAYKCFERAFRLSATSEFLVCHDFYFTTYDFF